LPEIVRRQRSSLTAIVASCRIWEMRTLLGLAILFGDPLTFDTTPLGEKDRPCRPGPMASDWNPYDNIPTTTKKGVDYLEAQAKTEEPFFLYFAYPSPHAPIIPNDEFDGKSKAGLYGDLVYETDHSIGQLLKALKDSGQAENPIVIFSADNGPEHYACARDAKFDHWSAHPFR